MRRVCADVSITTALRCAGRCNKINKQLHFEYCVNLDLKGQCALVCVLQVLTP